MTAQPRRGPLPCFVNPRAGRAAEIADAISVDDRLRVRDYGADELGAALRSAVESGAPRLAIVGGDGSVAAAAQVVAGTDTALAIIPAGTLNHFARDLGIPTDLEAAVGTATGGTARPVDVGFVNERLFLSTSSVGAYLRFVRRRERYEPYVGYYLASAAAALRTLLRLRSYRVAVKAEGNRQVYRSPLVFVGVGERDLRLPAFGRRVEDGRPALHVIVTRGRSRTHLVALGLVAAVRRLESISGTPHLDVVLTDTCTVDLPWSRAYVALDGEEARLATPLRYRLARGALKVVLPPEQGPTSAD